MNTDPDVHWHRTVAYTRGRLNTELLHEKSPKNSKEGMANALLLRPHANETES